MRLASAIVAVVLNLGVGCAKPAANPDFVFPEILEGNWGWTISAETCAANPHTLRFLEESQTLEEEYSQPVTNYRGEEVQLSRYDVLFMHLEDGFLLLRLHGETRLTVDGELVTWRMRFVPLGGRAGYVWERTDIPNGRWGPIVRCPA